MDDMNHLLSIGNMGKTEATMPQKHNHTVQLKKEEFIDNQCEVLYNKKLISRLSLFNNSRGRSAL